MEITDGGFYYEDASISTDVTTNIAYITELTSMASIYYNNSTSNASAENASWYDDYYGDEEYYYDDYYFEVFPFEIYALGYIQPILILFTALSNVFVAGFFLTRKDRGKATNLLFISIAFSDTMTGVTLLPNAFEVYANYRTEFTRDWCNAYMILRFYVSPAFHTVSVWQTVALCVQRYLCVCHPFISSRICTFWKTFVSIFVMYNVAAVLHVYHLVDNKIGHFRCRWQVEKPCKESCMYLWFCIVLQHLLPCILLVSLTTKTIIKLGNAQKRLSSMSHMRSLGRTSRDKIITYTAALIVLFFLVPELPHGLYKLVFVVFNHAGERGFSAFDNRIIITVYEVALTVSFCANFWIYCCMMRDFRRKLLELLSCGKIKHVESPSVSSKVGMTTLSRSSSNASRNRVFSRSTLHSNVSENLHSVIPLTPTAGCDYINFQKPAALKVKDDDVNDDVFVDG